MFIPFSFPLIPAPLTLEYLRSALRVLPHAPALFRSLTRLVLGACRGLEERKSSPRRVLSAAGLHVSRTRPSLGTAFRFRRLPASVQGSRGCVAPSQGFLPPTASVGGCHVVGLSSPSTSAATLRPGAVGMWGEHASLPPSLPAFRSSMGAWSPFSKLSTLVPLSLCVFVCLHTAGVVHQTRSRPFSKGATGSALSKPAARDETPLGIPRSP